VVGVDGVRGPEKIQEPLPFSASRRLGERSVGVGGLAKSPPELRCLPGGATAVVGECGEYDGWRGSGSLS
jgi:hypothetical protein